MRAWTEKYLTIPFREHGRTRDGVDCYGLACLVYQEELGMTLPSYTEAYATTQDAEEIRRLLHHELGSHWRPIPLTEAREFDGVIFRILGHPTHFGLVLQAPWFLHSIKDTIAQAGKVRMERWDSMLWAKRVMGAVRWQTT